MTAQHRIWTCVTDPADLRQLSDAALARGATSCGPR